MFDVLAEMTPHIDHVASAFIIMQGLIGLTVVVGHGVAKAHVGDRVKRAHKAVKAGIRQRMKVSLERILHEEDAK